MKKKKDKKNYIILIVIIIATVLVAFYARSWYITTKDYDTTSIISETVNEINENEVSNFISENPNVIIYASSPSAGNTKSFENAFKKYIEKNNLANQILYIDLDKNKNIESVLKPLGAGNKIKSQISNNKPALYIFNNGKITKAFVGNENLNMKQISKYLKKIGVTEDE